MNVARGIFSGFFSFILVIALIALGIAVTINYTILNPDFIISELDKLDVHSIIMDQVRSQLPEEEPHMTKMIAEVATDLEPWLKKQTTDVIYAGYAYLKKDEELNIVISLEQVKTSIKGKLAQAVREFPPPELEGATQSQIDFFLSQVYGEIDSQIPEKIEINEAFLGPG